MASEPESPKESEVEMSREMLRCPHCNILVAKDAARRDKHIQTCRKNPNKKTEEEWMAAQVQKAEPAASTETAATNEAATVTTAAPAAQVPVDESEEDRIGRIVAERMVDEINRKKDAPAGITIEEMETAGELRTETKRLKAIGAIPPDYVEFWGYAKKHHTYPPLGYRAVRDPAIRRQAAVDDLECWMRPRAIRKAQEKARARAAKAAVDGFVPKVSDEALFRTPQLQQKAAIVRGKEPVPADAETG